MECRSCLNITLFEKKWDPFFFFEINQQRTHKRGGEKGRYPYFTAQSRKLRLPKVFFTSVV